MPSMFRSRKNFRWLTALLIAVIASQPMSAALAAPRPTGSASPARIAIAESDQAKPTDAPVVDRGDFYWANGQKVTLFQRTDQLVIATDPKAGDAVVAQLTDEQAPLAEFQQVRELAPSLYIVENPDIQPVNNEGEAQRSSDELSDAATAATNNAGVLWTAPVFMNAETGTWQVATDEVIVKVKAGVDPAEIFDGDARFTGYRPLLGTPDQFVVTVADGGGVAAVKLANQLKEDDRLDWAGPNFYQEFTKQYTPNDPIYPQQWHLNNTGQNGGTPDADVDAPDAWDVTPGGSNSVVVAIVDDGMEYSHPDLAPNLFTNPGEIAGNRIDDDGNGWVDDTNGWDFTSNDNFPGASSVNDAHATSVAGVTAAVGDNNLGVTGIAYRARLLPIRIFGDSGSATTDANIASAIYYAAGRTANGLGTWRAADILNNSWGGGAASTAITAAFTWAGTNGRNGRGAISFIAAGNGGTSSISYPANLAGSVPGVIAVGASTNQDVRSSYSQFGPQLDFTAPSNGGTFGIVTVDRQGTNGYNTASGTAGDYTTTAASAFGGTSSATPLAAGIGALLLSLDPTLTATQVRGLMRNTTDLIGPLTYNASGFNTQYGYGRVNAATAVRGVGVAEVQVLDGAANIPDETGTSSFSALVSQTQTRTFRVRNQGTVDLNLGSISVSAGPFSLASGFTDTTLSVGESTTFSVSFTPTTGGAVSSTISFSSNDSDESPFNFTLNGTGVVPSIAGYTFEDWNGNGVRDANDPGLGGWQVYLDQNNNGAYDGDPSYTTSPNLAIPDNNATGITSSQTISGLSGTITDLNVRINITHTFVGDLVISLVSPAGTTVSLINRRGSSGDNFTNTVLDDEAATSITSVTSTNAPFTGNFRPESPLSLVDGQDPNGTWQLRVTDRAGADVGTLVNWSLIFGGYAEPSVTTDSSGFYSFLSLPPATYTVRRVVQSGWNATGPAGGSHTVTVVDANTTVTGQNFGQNRQNALYGQQFNDLDNDGVKDAGEPGAAGWTVYLDRNNNGSFDSDSTFTATPNLAIPDNNVTGITSSQTVSGLSGGIQDINVRINITHTFVGDLVVSLVSPAGTTIPLINRRGGSGLNFTNTVLDDEAATSITTIASGGAPFTGSFRPESPLSAVDGQNPNGTWQLRVRDAASLDVGVLVNWSITFANETGITTSSNGNYVFTNLPAGTHTVRQVDRFSEGWVRTVPASGGYTVTLNSGDTSVGNDFGNYLDEVAPTTTASVSGSTHPLCPSDCYAGSATVTLSASDDAAGVADTQYQINGSGFQTYSGPFSITIEGTHTVEFYSTDALNNVEEIRSITVKVSNFPGTSGLDNFNRANGRVGGNWTGATQSDQYVISGSQVDVGKGGALSWRLTSFGADQEAFIRLSQIDPNGRHHTLMLKSRGTDASQGGILVSYDAVSGQVVVEALVVGQGWRTVASFPATMANGDTLGARARADGTVQVYVNCMLVGTADTRTVAGNAYVNQGGRIGVWFENSAAAAFDDFGGGNSAP